MAQKPNFDPNNYQEFAREHIDLFTNSACQTLFEPGSVFKAITMSSALNEGKITPETSYYDNGWLTVGPNTIYNYAHRAYGQQTMTNVLEHSINTGAAYAQSRLGNELFTDYVQKFGIMEKLVLIYQKLILVTLNLKMAVRSILLLLLMGREFG